MDDLLRSISWNAEKVFRRHGGRFPSVLRLSEAADRAALVMTRVWNERSYVASAMIKPPGPASGLRSIFRHPVCPSQ